MNSSYSGEILIVGLGQQGTTFAKKLRDYGISIHATDIDPDKIAQFRGQFPDAVIHSPNPDGSILLPPEMPTIIASNTPDHERAITERIKAGTKKILSEIPGTKNIIAEKPLALNLRQTKNLIHLAQRNKVDLYTAFLIRFSPVIARLKEFMTENDLIMVSGEVDWGKNRIGNSRPTAGDLEDEAVHGMDILLLFAALNQTIESMNIFGVLEFDRYVNEQIQSKMHERDASYPLNPNSSSKVITTVRTSHAMIQTLLQSSFVAPTERRYITLKLAKKADPKNPLFAVRMDFDKRLPEGGVNDSLQIWNLQNTKEKLDIGEYPTDKLGDQTKAWLDTLYGGTFDNRLATTEDALRVALWTDAVEKSHKKTRMIRVGL